MNDNFWKWRSLVNLLFYCLDCSCTANLRPARTGDETIAGVHQEKLSSISEVSTNCLYSLLFSILFQQGQRDHLLLDCLKTTCEGEMTKDGRPQTNKTHTLGNTFSHALIHCLRSWQIARAWSNEEQKLLEQALKTYPASLGAERWVKIASVLPNRLVDWIFPRSWSCVNIYQSIKSNLAIVHGIKIEHVYMCDI